MGKILITGASSGMGLSIGKALLDDGHEIINISRRPCPVEHGHVVNACLDLADIRRLPEAFKSLAQQHDDVDALVLCAGQGRFRMLEEFSHGDIESLMHVNFTSHAFLLKSFLPVMKRRKQGRVIILGSESALQGGKQGSIYCASKFALRGMALSLRQECAKSGIAVSLINPGMVDSPFFDQQSFRPGQDESNSIKPEDVTSVVLMILYGRAGTNIDEVNLSPLKKVIEFD